MAVTRISAGFRLQGTENRPRSRKEDAVAYSHTATQLLRRVVVAGRPQPGAVSSSDPRPDHQPCARSHAVPCASGVGASSRSSELLPHEAGGSADEERVHGTKPLEHGCSRTGAHQPQDLRRDRDRGDELHLAEGTDERRQKWILRPAQSRRRPVACVGYLESATREKWRASLKHEFAQTRQQSGGPFRRCVCIRPKTKRQLFSPAAHCWVVADLCEQLGQAVRDEEPVIFDSIGRHTPEAVLIWQARAGRPMQWRAVADDGMDRSVDRIPTRCTTVDGRL